MTTTGPVPDRRYSGWCGLGRGAGSCRQPPKSALRTSTCGTSSSWTPSMLQRGAGTDGSVIDIAHQLGLDQSCPCRFVRAATDQRPPSPIPSVADKRRSTLTVTNAGLRNASRTSVDDRHTTLIRSGCSTCWYRWNGARRRRAKNPIPVANHRAPRSLGCRIRWAFRCAQEDPPPLLIAPLFAGPPGHGRAEAPFG